MRKQRVVIWLLRICVLTWVFGMTSADQEASAASRQIAGHEYATSDDRWYVVSDGRPAALIDQNFLVVRFIGSARLEDYDLQALGLPRLENVMGRFADGHYVLRTPPGRSPFEVADAMDKTGIFEDIRFSVLYEPYSIVPDDDHYDDQWNLHRIGMSETWELTTGTPSVIVGIIDSGVDYYHEDLASNIWASVGYDFYDDDSDPYPDDGCVHGTLMAGIIAAATNNSMGVSGIAGGWGPQPGVSIMVMDAGHYIGWPYEDCYMNDFATAAAIDSAVAWGAKVLNMSFGADVEISILKNAIDRAVYDHDVAAVAASGIRGGPDSDNRLFRWPARWPNVISVGATEQDDSWWFPDSPIPGEDFFGSCLGNSPAESLDIVAPGDIPIWSTDITGEPGDYDGDYSDLANSTSGACAHVAGAVALMRSANPSLRWWQIRDILRDTAYKDIPGMEGRVYTDSLGFGRLDAYEAVWRAKYNAEVLAGHTITSNTTWPISSTYENVYLMGDVTVEQGATLTIMPGTTVYFESGNDDTQGGWNPSLSELIVWGSVTADASDSDEIVFRSSADQPAQGDWAYIWVGTEPCTLRNCTVRDATHGLIIKNNVWSGGPSVVQNCRFENNEVFHIGVECLAFELGELSPVWAHIRGCTFDVTCPYGIYVITPAESTTIRDCTISGASSSTYGVYIETHNQGPGMPPNEHIGPRMINTEILGFATGKGVQLDERATLTVRGCNIGNCKWGMYCTGTTSALVRNTVFDGCSSCGVEATWQAEPDLGTIQGEGPGMNSFYGSCGKTYKHVKAPYRDPYVGPVMAEMNWWGSGTPSANCFSTGTVDYTPWLASDPNDLTVLEPIQAAIAGISARASQNYPNPFSGVTSILYAVPRSGTRTVIQVFDVKGRLVRRLVDRPQESGEYEIKWDGLDDGGRRVASGVYFLLIETGDDFKEAKKMILER